jgi:hypothetical protein
MQRGQIIKGGRPEPEDKQAPASGVLQKDSPSSEAVADQLERVLASSVFKSSRRTSLLLRFIVERTLAGGTDLLKERLLGNEVFGRAPDYDTSSDHIVRSTAGEIRKRLAQYYLEPGHELEIRIDLLPGSYVPQFRVVVEHALGVVGPPPSTAMLPEVRSMRWIFPVLVLGVALSLTAALAMWWVSPCQTALDRFWGPLLEAAVPVVICTGDPRRAWAGSEATAFYDLPSSPPLANNARLAAPAVPPLWFYRTVPFGDAMTLAHFTALISGKGKDFRTVYSPDSTLADLRQNSAVLIGGIDNFWTMRLTRDLRYGFQIDRAENKIFIEDRRYPGRRDWAVDLDQARGSVTVDYALVARVIHPDTMKPLVIVGGIRDCGTVAAGEFLTSAASLRELERRAPRHWTNVEAVLSTKVFRGSPGPPQLVAAYFW